MVPIEPLIVQLRGTLGKLQTALSVIPEALVWTDAAGKIQWCNQSFEKLARRDRLSLIGASFSKILLLKKNEKELQPYEFPVFHVLKRGPLAGELYEQEWGDGIKHIVEISGSMWKVEEEEFVVLAIRDVTEKRKMEEEVEKLQKIDVVGRLAGGIAPELSELLTSILSCTERVLHQLDPFSPFHNDIETAAKAAVQALALTRQLLHFGRDTKFVLQAIDLNEFIQNKVKMMHALLGTHIQISLHLSDGPLKIQGHEEALEEVFLNLALFSQSTMPKDGTLTIRTLGVDLTEEFFSRQQEAKPGKYALVVIQDTGKGLTKEDLEYLFDPFFEAKKAKKRSIELSLVSRIITNHSGLIRVNSLPGKGTTFKIYLPAL